MSWYFSACCIASCEPAQIHGSISKKKMEIQKKIWTSRVNCACVNTCALTACADAGIFVKGGSNFFRGGGGRGVQMHISIEPHTTCDFPGGGPDPYPPSGPAHEQRSSKN